MAGIVKYFSQSGSSTWRIQELSKSSAYDSIFTALGDEYNISKLGYEVHYLYHQVNFVPRYIHLC